MRLHLFPFSLQMKLPPKKKKKEKKDRAGPRKRRRNKSNKHCQIDGTLDTSDGCIPPTPAILGQQLQLPTSDGTSRLVDNTTEDFRTSSVSRHFPPSAMLSSGNSYVLPSLHSNHGSSSAEAPSQTGPGQPSPVIATGHDFLPHPSMLLLPPGSDPTFLIGGAPLMVPLPGQGPPQVLLPPPSPLVPPPPPGPPPGVWVPSPELAAEILVS